MATDRQDFTLFQSTDRILRITVPSGLTVSSATAIVWRAGLRADGSAAIEKTLAGGGIANLTATTCDVALVPGDTEGLAPGEYYHELRVVNAAGNQDVVLEGTMTLKASLTD